jgi:hypothetical protein
VAFGLTLTIMGVNSVISHPVSAWFPTLVAKRRATPLRHKLSLEIWTLLIILGLKTIEVQPLPSVNHFTNLGQQLRQQRQQHKTLITIPKVTAPMEPNTDKLFAFSECFSFHSCSSTVSLRHLPCSLRSQARHYASKHSV